MQVLLSLEGQADFDALPATIKARVIRVLERLAQWPQVSGAKPLKREWAGHYRVRTGDWRVIFRVISPGVIVVRIQHRSQVYED
jgi:mRNA interferase RelE/StbE